MKSVYLARHAKSSWDNPDHMDHERPIIQLGVNRTIKICRFLKQKGIKPDLIISSHAIRAVETAQLIAEELDYPVENLIIEQEIYDADVDNIWPLIFGLDDKLNSVMIVGHNPTISHMANYLLEEKINSLPTSGIAAFRFETNSWVETLSAKRHVEFVVFPKMLK